MSVQAMVWVLEDAVCADGSDVPPYLVAPLLGLANHSDENGRGARCATETIAWYCRKKRDAARSDIDKMEALGLIRLGDQRMVLHLPPDRRPTVYDLAMELKRKPRPDRKPRGRPRKPQATASPENEGVPGPPGFSEKTGGSTDQKRGGPQTKNGGVHRPPEPSLEPKIEPTPPSPRRQPSAPPSASQGGGRINQEDSQTDPVAALVDELHAKRPRWAKAAIRRVLDEELADGRPLPLLATAARRCAEDMETRTPGRIREGGPWWDHAAAVMSGKARTPWCGECEADNRRFIYLDGTPDTPARCPRCGPGSSRPLTETYA